MVQADVKTKKPQTAFCLRAPPPPPPLPTPHPPLETLGFRSENWNYGLQNQTHTPVTVSIIVWPKENKNTTQTTVLR